jgi:hypothetical protein
VESNLAPTGDPCPGLYGHEASTTAIKPQFASRGLPRGLLVQTRDYPERVRSLDQRGYMRNEVHATDLLRDVERSIGFESRTWPFNFEI